MKNMFKEIKNKEELDKQLKFYKIFFPLWSFGIYVVFYYLLLNKGHKVINDLSQHEEKLMFYIFIFLGLVATFVAKKLAKIFFNLANSPSKLAKTEVVQVSVYQRYLAFCLQVFALSDSPIIFGLIIFVSTFNSFYFFLFFFIGIVSFFYNLPNDQDFVEFKNEYENKNQIK